MSLYPLYLVNLINALGFSILLALTSPLTELLKVESGWLTSLRADRQRYFCGICDNVRGGGGAQYWTAEKARY